MLLILLIAIFGFIVINIVGLLADIKLFFNVRQAPYGLIGAKLEYKPWFLPNKFNGDTNWERLDTLYAVTYEPETKLYHAGCFHGTKAQIQPRLDDHKRHKLALKWYRDQLAKIAAQYPETQA